MEIEAVRCYRGPNPFARRPMIVMTLDIGELECRPSNRIEDFPAALCRALPSLAAHRCSLGRPGGFLTRLHRGTYAGHIVEHVALELATLAGMPIGFGRTRGTGRRGVYTVAVELEHEQPTRIALEQAVALVDMLIADPNADAADIADRVNGIGERVAAALEACRLGPSTAAIVDAARARAIPVERLNDANLLRLGWGRERRLLQATIAETTSHLGVVLASDKHLTKQLLQEAAIAVPRGVSTRDGDEAVRGARRIGFPVVVKPRFGSKGRGVTVGCLDDHEVRRAFECARSFGPDVLIEEEIVGEVFRVLVVDGRIVAASSRRPAHVVGDGAASIAELIDATNRDPRRGVGHGKPLTRIEIDAHVRHHLSTSGRTVDDVPGEGELVTLRSGANLSTGGTATDVTDRVHPDVALLCERAARVIGLDICGLDVAAVDIAAPPADGLAVLEVNAAPGFRMHTAPSEGEARSVGANVVDMLYPPPSNGRIPIAAVTGTNGKTTVVRMIASALAATGRHVGMTTTTGVYVDGRRVAEGDCSGPDSARAVLADPTVDIAVLESARGGIARAGLAFDRCDVAVITNVTHDHIGQDGIRNLRDLIALKAVVAGAVGRGGVIVANADDPGARAVIEHPRVRTRGRQLVWFSLNPHSPVFASSTPDTGTTAVDALVLDGDVIARRHGPLASPLARLDEFPITDGGRARFNTVNLLAALGALNALGMTDERAVDALRAFRPHHNPDRAQRFDLAGGVTVLVDFGHNPGAFAAIGDYARTFAGRRFAIITVPGNRSVELLREAGAVAATHFDEVAVYETPGRLYGRAPGEVASIVAASAGVGAVAAVVPDARAALESALGAARAGDVIAVFVEHLSDVEATLASGGAHRPMPELVHQ